MNRIAVFLLIAAGSLAHLGCSKSNHVVETDVSQNDEQSQARTMQEYESEEYAKHMAAQQEGN